MKLLGRASPCLAAVLLACCMATPSQAQEDQLSVMTYNVRASTLYGWDTPDAVWYNVEAVSGNNAPTGQHWQKMERGDAAARTILDSGADVVGLQEYSLGGDLVDRVQAISGQTWHYANTAAGGILSRYPIVETSAGNYGARIQISASQEVWMFNIHVGLHPDWNNSYIPYAARDGHTEQEIIDFVHDLDNWSGAMTAVEADLAGPLSSGLPLFFTGDFNEPSHLDWTQAAVDAGYIPLAVDAPLSHLFIDDFGFNDSYHDDRLQDGETEVSRWGYTWTSDGAGVSDDDRIDFVYYQGEEVAVLDSLIIGDANGSGVNGSDDVNIKAWWDDSTSHTVSDHRAVVSTFSIPETTPCSVFGDLTGDCKIDAADWALFREAQHADLLGLTPRQAYEMGDLNGDFKNNHADFVLFKGRFESANGAGSFAVMVTNVPEPASLVILVVGGLVMLSCLRRNPVVSRQSVAPYRFSLRASRAFSDQVDSNSPLLPSWTAPGLVLSWAISCCEA